MIFFDVAVVVSNDSDLAEPIQMVRRRFGKAVGLLGHRSVRVSGKLRPLANFIRSFPTSALQKAQFPKQLSDTNGTFSKPPQW